MPDLSPFAASLGIALLTIFMLWFALGTQRNIRKGNELLAWLQTGLPLLGQRTTLRWLGSSVVELRLVEPSDPFRDVTVMAVLEPRDMSLLWALARRRGRRDFLIFRCDLRRAPRLALEVGARESWTGRDRPRAYDEEPWTAADWGGDTSVLLGNGADSSVARDLWRRLERVSGGPWRLSVRRTVPHLEVHVLPPDLQRVKAAQLAGTVREIAQELVRER